MENKNFLHSKLWDIANILRGKIDNDDEYKNYILGFIFFKFLSKKLEKLIIKQQYTKEKLENENIQNLIIDELGYFFLILINI